MPADIHWIPLDAPGRLGIMPRPRGGDWLAKDLERLAAQGVSHVVSLLEPGEAAELDLAGEASECAAAGLTYLEHPVRDHGVPASPEAFLNLAAELHGLLIGGASLVVHCHAGIGRSGLLACCVLVRHGLSPDAALEAASRARGLPVPETPEQLAWFRSHAGEPRGGTGAVRRSTGG